MCIFKYIGDLPQKNGYFTLWTTVISMGTVLPNGNNLSEIRKRRLLVAKYLMGIHLQPNRFLGNGPENLPIFVLSARHCVLERGV
jgi:hypothetical protein